MDPKWLLNLSRRAQESVAGTEAEWGSVDRFIVDLERLWTDAAGRAMSRGHVDAIRSQAGLLRAAAGSHVAAIEGTAPMTLDFVGARSRHADAASRFRRSNTDAVSDLDQSVTDSGMALALAGSCSAAADDAAAMAAKLEHQS